MGRTHQPAVTSSPITKMNTISYSNFKRKRNDSDDELGMSHIGGGTTRQNESFQLKPAFTAVALVEDKEILEEQENMRNIDMDELKNFLNI